MAYQTLYRKYRPKTFELLFGQDTIVKTLKNVIKNNKLSHAYLFTGPRGTGKTSSAKLFAKAINCINNENGDACNSCENCESFNKNNNPDIIEIDAASNNGVDEIREIKNKVNLVPSMSKYKVYIIDEVHMLSIGAFNALLKTLEEPPEYIIFILATTEPQKLPATIISRCQRFDFKSISAEKMRECLMNIVEKENIEIESEALDEIILNSKGGMRDAIGLLDQASAFSDNKVTLKDIEDLSGNISDKEIRKLFEDILNKKYDMVFENISKYSSQGKDFSLICEKFISYIRLGILFKKNVTSKEIEDADKYIFDKISDSKLYLIIDFLSETLNKLKNNYQKELTFEVQMIQLIDLLGNFSIKNNVSRETLPVNEIINNKPTNVPRETLETTEVKQIDNKVDVPRGTSEKKDLLKNDEESNVPRETLPKKDNLDEKLLNELKNIRINNILMEATKTDMNFVLDLWTNINDYLIDDGYKLVAGILANSKPVAASRSGIIITLPLESSVNRIEKEYDVSKKMLEEIYNENYKIVYIAEKQWKELRPTFVEKKKNGELNYIDEKETIEKYKNLTNEDFVNEFDELVEMEEN